MKAGDSICRRDSSRAVLAGGLAALVVLGGTAPAAAQSSSAVPAQAAVTTRSESSAADGESLRARAATFWAARVAGDTKAQWELLEPRGRGRTSPSDYVRSGPIRYLGYQIEDATVSGYFATVRVRLVVVPVRPDSGRSLGTQVVVGEDEWVRIQGVWYRTLEQARARKPREAERQ
jgi:hypothetical protein